MSRRLDVLEKVHGIDNVDAIRAELQSSTVQEIADRYDIEHMSVMKVERKYGVRCMRKCAQCKQRIHAVDMKLSADGKIGQICKNCKPINRNRKPDTSHWARTMAEYLEIPAEVYAQARRRWGRADGIWCRFVQGGFDA